MNYDTTDNVLWPYDRKDTAYECPFCDYMFLDENEAEQTCDCGCPSCRKIIHWEEWPDQIT